jgi:hypothetical protein
VLQQGTQYLVSWTLSEPSPETWWSVLRQKDDGTYEPVVRIRAESAPGMSWLDPSPPAGIPRYRIRRECLDTRFQWLSEPSDGAVPALPSLASVQAKPGQVTISWYSAGDHGAATVYRRTAETDWMKLGEPNAQGDGLLTYEDQGLPAGRYAYRLGFGTEFTHETWVDVPGFSLALGGLRPNPAVGSLKVAFTLPANSPATLEIFTVAGRRVLQQDVGSYGVGDHVLDLGRSTGMRPGVYWIRLTQGGKSLTTKGVLAN